MTIADFYTKPLEGKLFRLFQNLILNLREEDIRNITLSEKLTQMETNTEYANRAIAVESAQECVGENKAGSLNTVNRDVCSDDINQAVDMHEIISRVKPYLLSRLKSVAAGVASKINTHNYFKTGLYD